MKRFHVFENNPKKATGRAVAKFRPIALPSVTKQKRGRNPLTRKETAISLRSARTHESVARKAKSSPIRAFNHGAAFGIRDIASRFGAARLRHGGSARRSIGKKNPSKKRSLSSWQLHVKRVLSSGGTMAEASRSFKAGRKSTYTHAAGQCRHMFAGDVRCIRVLGHKGGHESRMPLLWDGTLPPFKVAKGAHLNPSTSRALVRVTPILKSPRRVSSASRSRGRSATTNGGRSMATSLQRDFRAFFARHRKAGKSAKAIGAAWRSSGHARRNPRGKVLSGPVFRPSLPARRGVKAVRKAAGRKYKAAIKRRMKSIRPKSKKRKKRSKLARMHSSIMGRKRKAGKNPMYTVFNNRRSKKRKKSKARSRATRRYRNAPMNNAPYNNNRKRSRKGRRWSRNFSIAGIKSRFMNVASKQTLMQGLAVLAGAVAAQGAPSLVPGRWNPSQWTGIAWSLLSAAGAAVIAAYIAPQYLIQIASGGVVVVGLRLIQTYQPKALDWKAGVQAGFLGRGRVGGFLDNARQAHSPHALQGFAYPPHGTAAFALRGPAAGMGLMGAARETFRGNSLTRIAMR